MTNKSKTQIPLPIIIISVLFLLYTAAWFALSKTITTLYDIYKNETQTTQVPYNISITGYPFTLKIKIPTEKFQSPQGHLTVNDIQISAWPIPFTTIKIQTGQIQIQDRKWSLPLTFDNSTTKLRYNGKHITIKNSILNQKASTIQTNGTIDPNTTPPNIDAIINITNHQNLITSLESKSIITPRMATWATAGLTAFQKNGTTEIPLKTKGNNLYAGPIKILKLKNDTTSKQRQSLTPIPYPLSSQEVPDILAPQDPSHHGE